MNRNRVQSSISFNLSRKAEIPPTAYSPSPVNKRGLFLQFYIVDAIFGPQGKRKGFESTDPEGKPSKEFAKWHGWQTVRKIFETRIMVRPFFPLKVGKKSMPKPIYWRMFSALASTDMDFRSAAAGMIDQACKCDAYAVSYFQGVAEAVEFLHRRTPEDPVRMWLGLLARYLNDHPGEAFPANWRPMIGDLREFLKAAGYGNEHRHGDKFLSAIWKGELHCRCARRGHPRKKEIAAVLRILGDPFHWLTFEGKSVPR